MSLHRSRERWMLQPSVTSQIRLRFISVGWCGDRPSEGVIPNSVLRGVSRTQRPDRRLTT